MMANTTTVAYRVEYDSDLAETPWHVIDGGDDCCYESFETEDEARDCAYGLNEKARAEALDLDEVKADIVSALEALDGEDLALLRKVRAMLYR